MGLLSPTLSSKGGEGEPLARCSRSPDACTMQPPPRAFSQGASSLDSFNLFGAFNCFGCGFAAAWLLVAILACAAPRAFAQPSMQTILTNGPSSNRLNIVVLSEGYTSNQLAQFAVDATNAVNALLSHLPYQEYRSYFNAFAIKVASNESGSDHPSWPLYHDTYFNSTFDPVSDRLITIPPNFADANDSHGQGKVDALLQTNLPNCHLPILLVNDINDGGSDGFNKTAIASTGYQLSEILTHETGHVLANLGDEYTNAAPGFPDTEEPNTTQQTNRLLIKWNAWISPSTPVPTTPPDSYADVIGLFQGAHYHDTGWYRPKLDCLMRDLYRPFCDVCSEALVLAIYQSVRPVDGFSPASTNFSVTTTQAVTFNLTLLQPSTHNLSVQWYTNSSTVIGATNPALTLLPQSLGNGPNLISAVVKDNTPLVRNDPTNLLSQTISWSLNVSIPQLRLDSPRWLTGGKFVFRIAGYAPQGVVVQSATNLSNWGPVATNSLVGGQLWYTNPSASSFSRRFYRATTPP
jgi:IgA Peptidase M64